MPAFQPGFTLTSRTFSAVLRRPDPSLIRRVIFKRFVVPVYKLLLVSEQRMETYSSRETGSGRVMTSGSAGGD